MKTGAVSKVFRVIDSPSRQGLIAVGEEWVQVERPQPRSGEDERPGRVTRRRQRGRAAEEERDGSAPRAGPVRGGGEPGSSLYRLLGGRTWSDGRGFAPVAHLSRGPSMRPEPCAGRLPERRACAW